MNIKNGYKIKELSTESGISRRMIKYYIKAGLIQPPTGNGRGAYYSEDTMKKLLQIRDFKAKGFSVAIMRDKMNLLHLEPWKRIILEQGLEIHESNEHERKHPEKLERVVELLRTFYPEEFGVRQSD